jgi:predicted TIM-barrel fold metal-dependent hydrolase
MSMKRILFVLLVVVSLPLKAEPFVDIHTHYNWDQAEVVSPQQVMDILDKYGVTLAVVTSTPSLDALELKRVGGDRIVPFFSPYITGRSRHVWAYDERVLVQARQALSSGKFFGIGETHLYSGLGPRRDNKIFEGLLALAVEFDVPFMIHTEASDYRYFLPICQKHTKVRFLWAHAGSILGPKQVGQLLAQCPNVWVDLSARDPWHYGSLVSENGQLPDDWRQLFQRYPDRFMVGTDPVWNAHQVNRWYEADEGWKHYQKFIDFHRAWLNQLPDELRRKLQYENGLKFLRRQ